jgi:hypothetical protein
MCNTQGQTVTHSRTYVGGDREGLHGVAGLLFAAFSHIELAELVLQGLAVAHGVEEEERERRKRESWRWTCV